MSGLETYGGPVSAALEQELRGFLQKHRIAVWLDDGSYAPFVRRLAAAREAGRLPYAVHAYDGSFLALMAALRDAGGGAEKPLLLLYLPGFSEETVRDTPLLELYAAGRRFRKALDTLIRETASGRLPPASIDDFLQATPAPRLEDADLWLHRAEPGGELSAELFTQHLDALYLDLHNGGRIHSRLAAGRADSEEILAHFEARIGMPRGWYAELRGAASSPGRRAGVNPAPTSGNAHGTQPAPTAGPDAAKHPPTPPANMRAEGGRGGVHPLPPDAGRSTSAGGTSADVSSPTPTRQRPADLARACASWALCVEYVADLERPPRSPALAAIPGLDKSLVEACTGLCRFLRAHDPEAYEQLADRLEAELPAETADPDAEVLGQIDTFRFEENAILDSALEALAAERWDLAARWARERTDGGSFWLSRDPRRPVVWQLVASAAALGQALVAAGPRLPACDNLGAAVAAYTRSGAAVDRAHRQLEQQASRSLQPQLPRFEALRRRRDALRELWRRWADGWAESFNALCERVGFLPPPALRQRDIFDEVVRPLTAKGGATALFVVDALRFEMAAELEARLGDQKSTTVRLDARLAELPTVTEVGMNVLAPVVRDGRLFPALNKKGKITGFAAGEFRVGAPRERNRAMRERIGGGCPWLSLEEVLALEATSLKRRVAQARLLVVHSEEIDKAGERGAGLAVFDGALQKLRAACQLLREAGVRRFVITADHGFLLLDDKTQEVQTHGRKIDPQRRHCLTLDAADRDAEVRVPLAALGYEDVAQQLVMPRTTAVFDTGRRARPFVHGGNSLQERVIPVLRIVHKEELSKSQVAYTLQVAAGEPLAGMHCLEATVAAPRQLELNFTGQPDVELALRCPGEGITVELCDARKGARLESGAIVARVGHPFEVFFRLLGQDDRRERVELYHPSGALAPAGPAVRFTVAASRHRAGQAVEAPAPAAPEAWLEQLPEGVRAVFAHLAAHGALTLVEATGLLGGARQQRRFARNFEKHAALAPFDVAIQVTDGVQRYVRRGGSR